MSRVLLGLVGGLAALAMLTIASLSNPSTPSVLFYSPPMPSLAEYTAYPSQAGAGVFEYQTVAPTAGQTYTYTTNAAPTASTFEYTTTQDPGQYTYTAAPSDDGLTFYNAEETTPQMTVINGYATEGNNMEQWYTMPVGTLHPLDTAGDWNSGAFDSVNPDGTARASAPLTLSGERDDGTVAADARAARGMGLRPAQFKAARFTQLLQAPEQAVWNTPASKVGQLSPANQRVWARHVMAQHQLHKVWATKSKDVRQLPAKEQQEWAEHVVAEAKKHAAEERGNAQWAHKVEELLNKQHRIRRAVAGSKAALHAQRKAQQGKTRFDQFGFPELSGRFSGSRADGLRAQSMADITRSLRDDRPCGAECQRRAKASAADMIPIQ